MIPFVKNIALGAVMVILTASCQDSLVPPSVISGRSIKLSFDITSVPQTKSLSKSLTVDGLVDDATLFVFDESGDFFQCVYSSDGRFSNIGGFVVGRTYDLYLLVNMGDKTGIITNASSATTAVMAGYSYNISSYQDIVRDGYLPLAGKTPIYVSDDVSLYPLTVYNLASKVTISVDKKLSNGYSADITSLKLKNSPSRVYPFRASSKAESTSQVFADCDRADSDEVVLINNGNSVSFYALENMQGESSAQSAKEKVGDNMTTYVEMTASIREGDLRSSTPTYRWYVGQESPTRDFNMQRSHDYRVALSLTNSGFDIDDARVENKEWQYNVTGIEIFPWFGIIHKGQTTAFVAYVLPLTLDESLRNVTWSVTDSKILKITSSTGTSCVVKGLNRGTATVIATSTTAGSVAKSVNVTVF